MDLPKEIVSRFAGKAISFTGFEVDIVEVFENGTEVDPLGPSIPSYEVYNHHYCATVRGEKAKMVWVGKGTGRKNGVKRRAIEVNPAEWEPRALDGDEANWTVPTAQNFWQGNGGEHRLSFKHFPKGTGQLVESPQQFILQPMLINTKNPKGPGPGRGDPTLAAPVPKASSINRWPADYKTSPLMECPCTTRVKKILSGYETKTTAAGCGASLQVSSARECFDAGAALVSDVTANVTDPASVHAPAGCYVVSHSKGKSGFGGVLFETHFNPNAASSVRCGSQAGPVRSVGADHTSAVGVELDLDSGADNVTITLKGPADVWFGIGFGAQKMSDAPWTVVVDGSGEVSERKLANHMPGTPLPPSVRVLSNSVGPKPTEIQMKNHFGYPFTTSSASAADDCEKACDADTGCKAWTWRPPFFSTPYNLDDATCYLRSSLTDESGQHSGFTNQGWVDGMVSALKSTAQERTVVLQRALAGRTAEYYSFDARAASVPFIDAVGTTSAYQYHGKVRGGSSLMLVETGAPVCVCRGEHTGGSINGLPWSDDCAAYPETTIARDHNPSCAIETYGGGMKCCHHGVHLLDADQEVPSETYTYAMKFRFFYEDPEEIPGYKNAFFMFHEAEQNHGEYDVVPCAAGTAPEDCIHEIVGQFPLAEAMHACTDPADVWCGAGKNTGYVQFLHISLHCHGPACIDMRMINADTNETICRATPVYGTGDEPLNEAGYAAGILPCIWGTKEEGFHAPPVLSLNTNITVIKRANATYKHYGNKRHIALRHSTPLRSESWLHAPSLHHPGHKADLDDAIALVNRLSVACSRSVRSWVGSQA